ncbi:MAG: hypothetical protein WCB18_01855 [Thermoplasmata archaeon]
MPQNKKSPKSPAASKSNAVPPSGASPRGRSKTAPQNPIEESLELWTRFAQQTGETVTEYLRRFGDEQQKNYESWAASLRDATRPASREKETDEVQARFQEWNRRAEEIGERVREAFTTTMGPQKELIDLWVKPFLPKQATNEDRTREATELIQRLWTGLGTDVFRRLFTALQPGQGVEELIRVQESSLKEFTDSFQKLTQIYFTSPAFVTMFGKTLDASLDSQKLVKDQETVFSKMTGLPSRREITELNEAVRDLSEKVTRMSSGRA